MQTRRSTKGPGQGDSAVAQDIKEESEKEAESLKEMEPSSTTYNAAGANSHDEDGRVATTREVARRGPPVHLRTRLE